MKDARINSVCPQLIQLILLAVFSVGLAMFTQPVWAYTITVDDTGDWTATSGDNDNAKVCLREAVLLANGTIALTALDATNEQDNVTDDTGGSGVADAIKFDTTVFPVLTGATITLTNVTSGTGYFTNGKGGLELSDTAGDTLDASGAYVILSAASLGTTINCLTISGGNAKVYGMVIKSDRAGGQQLIRLMTNDSNTIGGSRTSKTSNYSSVGKMGLGNALYASRVDGIRINSGSGSNTIIGNYIGLQEDGTTVNGNNNNGLHIQANADTGNVVGASTNFANECNVIEGNGAAGSGDRLGIVVDAASNTIKGNIIGLDKDEAATGNTNQQGGILVTADDNTIGGTTAVEKNVVCSNEKYGIFIGSLADNNSVKGNYIGINSNGVTLNMGNGDGSSSSGGIVVGMGYQKWATPSNNNTIGGTDAGAGNIICGNNKAGINIGTDGNGNDAFGVGSATNTYVYGNYIGLNSDGTAAGNVGAGIYLDEFGYDSDGPSWSSNYIGGVSSGQANTIANNSTYGVYMTATSYQGKYAVVRGNSIYSNTSGGIYINPSSPAAVNDSIAAPTISTAVDRKLTGTTTASTTVDIYSNSANSAQGKTYIGTATVSGTGWTYTQSGAFTDSYFVATATDATNNTSSDSSVATLTSISKLAFTSATMPQSVARGSASSAITVETEDSSNNAVNVGVATTISLSSNSATGGFSTTSGGTYTSTLDVTIAEGSSSTTFYYKDTSSGSSNSSVTITADESPSLGWTAATGTITLTTAAASFSVSPSSTTQTAGTAFTLTVTAKSGSSGSGSTDTNYSGTVNLSVTAVSPTAATTLSHSISSTQITSWSDGVGTASLTYPDCGTITITATDSASSTRTGTSSNTTFYPSSFTVTPASATQTVAKAFDLTVTAKNSSGTTTPNYSGTVNLTEDGTGSLSTTSITASSISSGAATISNSYNRYGTAVKITATDSTNSSSTGTSSNIAFLPKDFSISLSSIPSSRTYYYTNESFSATVTARDNDNSAISNYTGTVSFTGTNLSVPSNYTFTTDDSGAHKFTGLSGTKETSTTLSVKDTTHTTITGASSTITIKDGTIKVIATSGPVGSLSVPIRILDSSGSILTEDDSTTFTVTLVEVTTDNDSAKSSATSTSQTVTDGVATITITDTEAESITVTPSSTPTLTATAGTVRFGTVSGTGVGVMLYREIKEPTEER